MPERLPSGSVALVARKHDKYGLCGFGDHMLNVVVKILGRTPIPECTGEDGYLCEFKHPVSHRVVTAGLIGSILEPIQMDYDTVQFNVRGGQMRLWVSKGHMLLADVTGLTSTEFVEPCPPWPEIKARVIGDTTGHVMIEGKPFHAKCVLFNPFFMEGRRISP